jgi:carbamoyl-phosphate synthase large subunit
MFNLDGSEGMMCGNAIRCVAKYLYDNGIISKQRMCIETRSGVKELLLTVRDNRVYRVTVDMGRAELAPSRVPALLDGDSVVDRPVEIAGGQYRVTCVSIGNPHCVVFVEDETALDLAELGPKFEFDKLFPERVNAEFVRVVDGHTLKMRVWERGSGETMACGTGACAAAVAAVLNGYAQKGEDIRVAMNGGELTVNYTDEQVWMTGAAEKVFEGVVEV